MSNNHQLPLSVQPIISYPREAEVGKTYLMTIDLQTSGDDWPYEEEEYPIYCMLETSPLFSSKPVGEPAVVLHRFGGTYGAAQFLLTAVQEEIKGEIKIILVNSWGMPVKVLNLVSVRVTKEVEFPKEISEEYQKAKLDSLMQATLDLEVFDNRNEFTVHFWGVRGSVACAGEKTVRYGGNTSCVEMRGKLSLSIGIIAINFPIHLATFLTFFASSDRPKS